MTSTPASGRGPETKAAEAGTAVSGDTTPDGASARLVEPTGRGPCNAGGTETGATDGPGRMPTATRRRRRVGRRQQAAEEALRRARVALSAGAADPSAPGDGSIFPAATRADLEPADVLDDMIRHRMVRANLLEDEWQRVAKAPTDERGQRAAQKLLASQDAVFRGLRTELVLRQREMQRVKTATAMAQEACVAFVRDMTDAYLRIARSNQTIVIDAVNQYLAGTIDGGELARKVHSVSENLGTKELGAEGQRLWDGIVATVFDRDGRAKNASRQPPN